MMWGKLLLSLTFAIIAIQSSVQDVKAPKSLGEKFALQDDTDKFIRLTLTMSELLETCKSLDINRFGLIRDHVHHSAWSRTFLNRFSLVQMKYLVLGEKELIVPLRRSVGLYRTKLNAFIVIASTATNLEYMLKRLRNTKWQNPEGLYIILDSFTSKSGCKNAESYLRHTWKLNVLDAAFFCLDFNGEILIYTYNPFTNRAPQPWQEVETSNNNTRSSTWALFKRKFISGETTCADLTFDKAIQLDGYEYNVLGVNRPPGFSVNNNTGTRVTYSGIDSKVHLSFVQHVNASPSLRIIAGVEIGWFEPNGEARHLLGNVSRGEYDIFANSVYNFNKHQASMTYPHRYTGLAILTKFAGFQTGQKKILHFMNPRFIGGIAIICIITIFVLGILNRYGIMMAVLEVTHLITNSGMTRRIERTPLRVYLSPVFLLFLLSNAAFQCKLSAILTRPLYNPNVNSLEDLQASDLRIITGLDYKITFNDSLLSNVQIIDNWNCSSYVISEENTACLADRYELMKIVIDGRQQNLHLSAQNILSVTSSFIVRPFWPLKQKFEEIISRLFTSGILDLWKRQDAQLFIQTFTMYRAMANDRSFRKLMMKDLQFAFFLLIIGLGLSICVFFIECTIPYCKKGNNRNKQRNNATFSFIE